MKKIDKQYDIVIIGAGVVGSCIARELSKYKLNVALLEKEADVAERISKANSGVIHAGFNIRPNTLKAKFNVEGLRELPKLADELGLKYKICKKLVVAKNQREKIQLDKLYEQGIKNNVPGLSIISEKQINQIEPGVNAKWALFSECTGIITPYLLTIALAENAFRNGVDVRLCSEVTGIKYLRDLSLYEVKINNNYLCKAKWVINSAGLNSDRIAEFVGCCKKQIYPCKGEYFILDKMAKNDLEVAVYPVPCGDNRGLGIHLTPTMNGNILIGPSAEYIDYRDNFSTTAAVMEQLKKEAFELMPSLGKYSFIRSYCGIRPKLFNVDSVDKFEDFYIKESDNFPGFINLHGIESPGLTGAPAIARYIIESIIGSKMDLEEKKEFIGSWNKYSRFDELSYERKKLLIASNKLYSEIFCRCEGVTKAEILEAVNNPLNALTLDAVKKRTHAMMGRCQAGFCMSRIVELLVKQKNVNPDSISLKGEGSEVIKNFRQKR